jgi:hypothetical protein
VSYGELDALRFKAELEVAQRELEDVYKKAGIAELEWEDQRKQLLETIDGTALKSLFDSNPAFDANHPFSCTLQLVMPSSTS